MAIKLVTISMRHFGQLNQNRLYVDTQELGMTEEEVAVHFRDNWVLQIRQFASSNVTYFNINVRSISPNPGLVFNLPIAAAGAQTPENHVCPFQSWVILLNTGLAGKKFRGRVYVPNPRPGDFGFGIITAQGVTIAEFALGALRPKYTTAGLGVHPVLVIHGETEAHDTHVTAMNVRSTMGCQRRRNIGVGQ